ncbi:GntR family transcriptional regulator [Gordonia sp. ABSL11-1]|uniref:FadR/GntR family transcriptional regulator n=1 Tax=Gordonia sp. ABSL11-1 TaxID=3053924 RepID=UPI002572CECE|nr:GntR family transcriptional regulator [Gordonia sp. ABSL11-1]MDL9948467.1 GntR family transcriptional regulator [Gordonia sp. ABSL11-1]
MTGVVSIHPSDSVAAQWQPLARVRTHDLVLAEVERRLAAGDLRSGDRLPAERQLADALNVSRGTVRQALRILEALGVVEAGTGSGPGSGSRIVSDSGAGLAMVLRIHLQLASFRLDELAEVYGLVVSKAARKAVVKATPADLDGLRELVVAAHRARGIEAGTVTAAFMKSVAQISGNRLLAVLSGAMQDAARSAFTLSPISNPQPPLGFTYGAIVDAIADGDVEAVSELVSAHVRDLCAASGVADFERAG